MSVHHVIIEFEFVLLNDFNLGTEDQYLLETLPEGVSSGLSLPLEL
jgi:hypothetical protein